MKAIPSHGRSNSGLSNTRLPKRLISLFSDQVEEVYTGVSYSGEAFDQIATVTFTGPSGQTRTTEAFYMGGNEWRWRFTGTEVGAWGYSVSSTDLPDLDGDSGNIEVVSNASDYGFLRKDGNKFKRQREGADEAFLLNSFQTDTDTPKTHTHLTDFQSDPRGRMNTYATHADTKGFSSLYILLVHNLLELGVYDGDQTSSETPSLAAFLVLDRVIREAYSLDMHIHFMRWAAAPNQFNDRKWSPKSLSGGINGAVDNRISRYIAARLGPLPGWSLSYGFDLEKWTSVSDLQVWYDFMDSKMGWMHMLSGRSGDANRDLWINGYSQWGQQLGDFVTDEYPSFSTLTGDIDQDLDNPHLLEERNIYLRDQTQDEQDYAQPFGDVETRRLMWRTAMAGGVGGWYGHFDLNGSRDPVWSNDSGYPNPEELKAHKTFWDSRFILGLERDNTLTNG